MTEFIVALGANLPGASGAVVATLERALELVAERGILVGRRSPWYVTPAMPKGSGPDFVNGAVTVDAAMAPAAFLSLLHEVEATLGRERPSRWAPRVCDLDLLGAGDLVLPDRPTQQAWMAMDMGQAQTVVPPRLILPHPRLQERAFVLVPMADIVPHWCHPVTGQTVQEMRDALSPEALAEIRPLA